MSDTEHVLRSLGATASLDEGDPRRRQLELDRAADTVMEWKQRECDAAAPMGQCLGDVLRQCPQPLRSRFEAMFNAWRDADRQYNRAVYQLVEKASNVRLPPVPGG
ncbi:MAG: hypothetical protein JW940_32450 [Polyangiaceae bacterium]|jgi:hypothetical protein|nr:hypothetical protein [Polyangiaceae bacterium]